MDNYFKMKELILILFLIPNLVLAETTSVWGDDGSLTIIQDTDMGIIQY